MRRLRILAVLGVLSAVVALTTTAGAATQTATLQKLGAQTRQLDLSSMAKIRRYLWSIGVNPRTVVIQRGQRNYAGPRCPGKRWTCTTRTRVLQVGSQNTMDCTDETCEGLMQTGPRNTFRCVWRTSDNPASQRCSVDQTGTWNYAVFEQVADQSSNTEIKQDATQIVEVHQLGTGPSPKNELHVYQRIKQSLTSAGAQSQDAHQVVIPLAGSGPPNTKIQEASLAGDNFADINQYIDQRGSGAATSQNQDTEGLPTDPLVVDCHSYFLGPTEPNQCVNAEQTTGTGGHNHLQLHQLIDEDAKSSVKANQTQGRYDGGIDGRVHQTVGGATGSSDSHAHQAMRQNVAGALGSTQVQIDPTGCCGISQDGGEGNSQNIDEAGSQNSDGNAEQLITLIGNCKTAHGSCSVHHHGRNDDDNETFSQSCQSTSDTPCVFTLTTVCESTELFEGEGSGMCKPPSEVTVGGPSLFTDTNFLPGVPLSGFEITMGLIEPVTSVLPMR